MIKKAERYRIFNPSFTENLRRMYLNNLFYADYLVGEVLRTLKNQNLFDRSLIIITSDHGEAFFEHGKYTHNSTNYDEMIRVPFLVKLPGQQEARIIDHPYSLVDLLPSLVTWLDLPAGELPGPGIPICLDSSAEDSRFRAIFSRAVGKDHNLSIVQNHHKYIFYSGRDELYNLITDPVEKHNLAQQQPLRVLRYKQLLFELLRQSGECQERLGIRPVTREQTDRSILKELKALGYL
jgi:arylsulfatase A-like enzyme